MEDLEAAAKLYISYRLELVTTPYGSALDATKIFWPVALPCKSHFKAAAKMRALKVVNVKTAYGVHETNINFINRCTGCIIV